MTKSTRKALMNGKGWFQYITSADGTKSVSLSLRASSEKGWFDGFWNNQIAFQTRGKKEAVLEFNRQIARAEQLVAEVK